MPVGPDRGALLAAKRSAGLLMYRLKEGAAEVLLIHPGGPYWTKKDDGASDSDYVSGVSLDGSVALVSLAAILLVGIYWARRD